MSVGGAIAPNAQWTHVWTWGRRPIDRPRKGMLCRVLAIGRFWTAQVLFEDGVTHFTSRRGLRSLAGMTRDLDTGLGSDAASGHGSER